MADKKISALTAASTPLAGTEVLPIVQGGATVKVAVSDLTAGRNVGMAGLTTTGNTILGDAQADTLNVGNGDIVKDNTGNTGFGTSPSYKVHIVESKTITPTTGDGQLAVVNSSATTTNVGAILLFSQSTRRAQISGGFGTTGNDGFLAFTVRSDASGFLEAARFDENYNLIIKNAAKGVNFTANTPAAGMTSQLLNWYEEGTFTPQIADAASGGNVATISGSARYTRIGRQVNIQFTADSINTTGLTAANTVYFRNFPFTSSSANNSIGSFYSYRVGGGSGQSASVLMGSSVTYARIFIYTGNSATTDTPLKVSDIVSGTSSIYFSLTYFV